MSRKTKRQRIFDLVVARMRGISVENGYETDAGALVEPWAPRFDDAELAATPSRCALGVYDLPDEVSKESTHSKGSTHRLRVQVRVFGHNLDEDALRAIIGDVVSAVGTDLHWTDPETEKILAMDTEPASEGFIVPAEAMQVSGGAVEFVVVYATAAFDPYQ